MKRICIAFLFVLVSVSLNAQYNLVPNPSFEAFDTCPNWAGQIYYALPWTLALHPNSPDYFNACDTTSLHLYGVPANFGGYGPARTGLAYANIVTYNNSGNPALHPYREYVQVELIDSLIQGVDYCIRFYVSLCNKCQYSCNNIGIYFSNVQVLDSCPPSNACNLPYIPQFENPSSNNLNDSSGWTLVSGSYTALGGEKFIVIGNFRDTSTTVASYTGWPGYLEAAYYIDDVLLTPCDSLVGIEEHSSLFSTIRLFPSPSYNIINIESGNETIQYVKLYSVLGKLIYQEDERIERKSISIDVSTLSKSVYIIQVATSKNKYNLKFIKN